MKTSMGKAVVVSRSAAAALFVLVVAVAVTTNAHAHGLSSSIICASTDYSKACLRSLAGAKSVGPKEVIVTAFQSTIVDLKAVLNDSILYKQQVESDDEWTKEALDVCEEVLNTSIEDLQRSIDKVVAIDASQLEENVDIKNWLSAALTNHDTCIDALMNTSGETGKKMNEALISPGEMLSNNLALITDFSTILGRRISSSRRISINSDNEDEIPSFIDARARRLMAASPASLKPNVTVAKDGSGNFTTINQTLNMIPKKSDYPFVIFVKAGVYYENIVIPKHYNNVVLIGEGPISTRISGNKCFAGGVATFYTATLVVSGENFIGRNIGIENTAGPIGHQAAALRVSGDKAVLYNVHIDGYQDTLYAHTYRQLYSNCRISGTIDFIFGNAVAVLQKCQLVVRKPMPKQFCTITAQGRKDRRSTGVTVVQGCHITAERDFGRASPPIRAYLGRPWKLFSRTIIMQSNIDGFIAPEGWVVWRGDFALDTLYYGEYDNRGNGSGLSKRVRWKGVKNITLEVARRFTPHRVFEDDEWVNKSGIPYVGGFLVDQHSL